MCVWAERSWYKSESSGILMGNIGELVHGALSGKRQQCDSS